MRTRWQYVLKQLGWVFLVLFLAVLVFALGLAFGYGGLGMGKNPWSILSPTTWQEIFAKFTGQ